MIQDASGAKITYDGLVELYEAEKAKTAKTLEACEHLTAALELLSAAEKRVSDRCRQLETALRDLIEATERADNPYDLGVSKDDDVVQAGRKLLETVH